MTLTEAKEIRTGDYQYDLPQERIARYPLSVRDESKLLLFREGIITDRKFSDLPGLFPENSNLYFNNSKVIRARLLFRNPTGSTVEIFCLEPAEPGDYQLSLSSTGPVTWSCMIGNLKKWKRDVLEMMLDIDGREVRLEAVKEAEGAGNRTVKFSWDDDSVSFGLILEKAGHIPIPPYLNREDEDIDSRRYQTVYASVKGSVAAPTAGLHFTKDILSALAEKNIKGNEITLHVGAGTFVPVKSETIGLHRMHAELITVSREVIEGLGSEKGIAVGTTSLRALESIYWFGKKLINNESRPSHFIDQWDPYREGKLPANEEVTRALLRYLDKLKSDSLDLVTSIIIIPGYNFRYLSGLITNFHMPESTLLMLIAACVGKKWENIYNHALANGYRFLSYGDSSLLFF